MAIVEDAVVGQPCDQRLVRRLPSSTYDGRRSEEVLGHVGSQIHTRRGGRSFVVYVVLANEAIRRAMRSKRIIFNRRAEIYFERYAKVSLFSLVTLNDSFELAQAAD
jgi:hypothetical protein